MAWQRETWKAARWSARVGSLAALALLPGLTACDGFFKCEGKTSCGTSGVSNTGDIVYVSNVGSTSLYAYFIGSDGSLNGVTGSPYTVSLPPASMVVTPDNSLLYVSTANGITSYAVSSTGVLSNPAQQSTTLIASQSMAVSPNGKWLIALDSTNISSAPRVRAYSIGSGGTLGATSSSASITSSQTIAPSQVAISADGKFVAAAMGNAGTLLWQFDQTSGGTGAFTFVTELGTGTTTTADFSAAFDANDNIYVARSGRATGIFEYSSSGTQLSPSSGPFATGNAPRSLVFASSGAFLYDANEGDSTISAFSVGSTALTAIGAAIAGPAGVQQLAVDHSGKYVLAAGTNSSAGLEILTIGSSGALTAGKTAVAGSANANPVMAVTH